MKHFAIKQSAIRNSNLNVWMEIEHVWKKWFGHPNSLAYALCLWVCVCVCLWLNRKIFVKLECVLMHVYSFTDIYRRTHQHIGHVHGHAHTMNTNRQREWVNEIEFSLKQISLSVCECMNVVVTQSIQRPSIHHFIRRYYCLLCLLACSLSSSRTLLFCGL